MIYYDRSLSIKTGSFVLNEDYSYINLSLLTPAKVETFYQKDYISKAGMCQAILSDIIDKIGKDDEFEDSYVEIKYQFYKNVEFVLWKADQKREKEEVSSILDSLNESRDDSVDSSLVINNDHISSIEGDDSSAWNSRSNDEFADKVPSSIVDGESEVASVFQMGTEKFMGSEKHYLSENFNLSVSNAPTEDYQADPRLQAMRSKVKRVSRRKEGFVKMEYSGKATMPVEEKKEEKLKMPKKMYTGSTTYTGPKNEAMVSENEAQNRSRLHDYSKKEGDGIPLNSFDMNMKQNAGDHSQDSETSNPMSFFTAMENMKANEMPYSVYRNNKIREGGTLLKKELEPIDEERTKSDGITESKTIDRDTSQGENRGDKMYGKSVELKLDLDNSQKHPNSKLFKSAQNIK